MQVLFFSMDCPVDSTRAVEPVVRCCSSPAGRTRGWGGRPVLPPAPTRHESFAAVWTALWNRGGAEPTVLDCARTPPCQSGPLLRRGPLCNSTRGPAGPGPQDREDRGSFTAPRDGPPRRRPHRKPVAKPRPRRRRGGGGGARESASRICIPRGTEPPTRPPPRRLRRAPYHRHAHHPPTQPLSHPPR